MFAKLSFSSHDPFCFSGKDLIIDGWFHERGELWPGQAMSLEVKKVLYHGRSKFQDVLVFVSETELDNMYLSHQIILKKSVSNIRNLPIMAMCWS